MEDERRKMENEPLQNNIERREEEIDDLSVAKELMDAHTRLAKEKFDEFVKLVEDKTGGNFIDYAKEVAQQVSPNEEQEDQSMKTFAFPGKYVSDGMNIIGADAHILSNLCANLWLEADTGRHHMLPEAKKLNSIILKNIAQEDPRMLEFCKAIYQTNKEYYKESVKKYPQSAQNMKEVEDFFSWLKL